MQPTKYTNVLIPNTIIIQKCYMFRPFWTSSGIPTL